MTTEMEILPEGKYKARPVEAGLGKASNDNPQVGVLFRLTSSGYETETITWYGSFSENKGQGKETPLERTIKTLRTCGWQGDDLSDLSSINEANEIDVTLVIEHSEWNGTVSAKVKWVNSGGGLGLSAPMKTDSAKAFAASMKGKVIAASRNVKSATPRSNGSHPNAPGSNFGPPREPGDDDLEF